MKNNGKTPIFNPSHKDFSVKYDVDGNQEPQTFTIKGKAVAYFDDVIAKHIKKHLANHLLHKRGVKNNPTMDLEEIYKEIEDVGL